MSGDGTIDEGQAPPKRRIFLRKRFVIAVASILLLLGGSGAAALYIGTDKILGKSAEALGGLDCKDVARVAIKRNDNQIWLHKYIKTDSTDGPTRIKTAIRVATGMAQKLRADMIHIVVLDQNGPTKRSEFKDAAFGAEVFYVRNVGKVPGFNATLTATYAVGSASANGYFYGKRRELTPDQALTLARMMKERPDCSPTDEEQAKMDAAAKAAEAHGKKATHETKPAEPSSHGEAEAAHVAPVDPALAAEAELDEALGIKPPPPPVEEAKAEPHDKAEKGFLDSMLSMVGMGSEEEAPKAEGEGHAAPAEGEGHAKPAEGEGHAAPAEGEGHAAPAEADAHAPKAEGEAHAPAEGEHGHDEHKLPPTAVDLKIPEKPVEEESMFSGLLGMVGLGGDDKTATEGDAHSASAPAAGVHGAGHGEETSQPPLEWEGHSANSGGEPIVPPEGETHEAVPESELKAHSEHSTDAQDHAGEASGTEAHTSEGTSDHGATAHEAAPANDPHKAAADAPAEEPTEEELLKLKAKQGNAN